MNFVISVANCDFRRRSKHEKKIKQSYNCNHTNSAILRQIKFLIKKVYYTVI